MNMGRAERRKKTLSKYISRAKEWFRMDGYSETFSSWKEFTDKCKWTKLLKHNKLYGRSTMNNIEKHRTNKIIREKSKKIITEEFISKVCGQCCFSCCTINCIDSHSNDKNRWCHKLNKSVWDLEDASTCKYYFD